VSIVLADPPKTGSDGADSQGRQQQAQHPATAPPVLQAPKALAEKEGSACPGTHQGQYDCNTISAIANVRQADSANFLNYVAAGEIGVGLFTAGVAYFAMRFAKRAANAASETLCHERLRSAAELRPWLSIDAHLVSLGLSDDRFNAHFEVVYKNIGQTAARLVWLKSGMRFVTLGEISDDISDAFAEWQKPEDDPGRITLMPGEERLDPGVEGSTRDVLKLAKTANGKRKIGAAIVATAVYWSDIGNTWCRTDRSFTIGLRTAEGFLDHHFLPEELRGQWGRETVNQQFAIMPFRSGQTT
jgi:hypothetical protein